jgi:hypothetical protein
MLLARLDAYHASKVDGNDGGDVNDAELVCSDEITSRLVSAMAS